MIDKISSWKYSEDLASEPAHIAKARRSAEELGVESVTVATGNQLATIAALSGAKSMVEIGTGAGVSSLWLLSASDESTLTTIDEEPEYQNVARENFKAAAILPSRVRVITGRASSVLGNMAEAAYDLVFLDLDPNDLSAVLNQAIAIAKPGGVIILAHALWRDRVPNPALREDETDAIRKVINHFASDEGYLTTMSMVGDGLLVVAKR